MICRLYILVFLSTFMWQVCLNLQIFAFDWKGNCDNIQSLKFLNFIEHFYSLSLKRLMCLQIIRNSTYSCGIIWLSCYVKRRIPHLIIWLIRFQIYWSVHLAVTSDSISCEKYSFVFVHVQVSFKIYRVLNRLTILNLWIAFWTVTWN